MWTSRSRISGSMAKLFMSRGMRPIFTTPDGQVIMMNTLMSDRIASCLNGNQERKFGVNHRIDAYHPSSGWLEGRVINMNTKLKLFSKKQRE